MRQTVFIERNEKKWKKAKRFSQGLSKVSADELAHLYTEITEDLSYVRTFYPESQLINHLNGLALNLHSKIYQTKREDKKRFITFFTEEVPLIVYRHRYKFLYAFLTFMIAVGIGLFSTYKDESFPRLILGDHYVNMTIENIKKGDPMAVYGSSNPFAMFMGIGSNNIRVSFIAFVLGIFASIGTGFVLFSNGVMVGAFIYFFVREELFLETFTTIMIHGTLELSAIVIAGAAGYILGNSWLFPGTYPRMASLVRGAKDAISIIIGLIPVFVIAALLESYVTRHYQLLGLVGRIVIMILSAAYIIYYFYILPRQVNHRQSIQENS